MTEEELVKEFPSMYELHPIHLGERDHMKSPISGRGIEHGEGWNQLVYDLCEKLSKFDVRITQQKEKFGQLRFSLGT